MENVFSSALTPNPASARDVLAFVLCPASLFVMSGCVEEAEAAALMMAPAKEAAARRFLDGERAKRSN